METWVISLVVNGLLGIAMYWMKMSHDQSKEEIKDIKQEQKILRDTTFKKEDFKDFKIELWDRLDRMDTDFKRRIEDLKIDKS